MDMVFDTATGQLKIDATDFKPWGANLRAMLDRHGQTVSLKGVEMRLTITADNAEIFDLQLPPDGVRYKQTDQDLLATGRVAWSPDQQIEVDAWCKTNAGHKVTAQASFIAPRPPQPYPSWTWGGTRWVAPETMPDGEGWQWSEEAGAWLLSVSLADSATLQTLDGVGPTLSQAIIDGRPWASVDDLTGIDGISAGMVGAWSVTL